MADGTAVALAPDPNHQPYIVDGVLPANECSLLSGASGVGKTSLVFQSLDRLRQSLSVFGQPARAVPFYYVACDLSGDTIRATMARCGVSPGDIPHLSLIDHREVPRNFPSILHEVRKADHSCQLLVVDALAVLLGRSNPNDYSHVCEFLTEITSLCKSHRITVLGLVHPAKSKVGEEYAHARQRIMGSGAWGAFCSTVLNLEADTPGNACSGARTLTIIPRNAPPLIQSWRFDDDGMLFQPDEGMDETLLDTWLAKQPVGATVQTRDLQLAASQHSISRATLFRWLKHPDTPLRRLRQGYYEVITRTVN